MQDTELIAKIKELKQIKPRQDWAILVKSRILKITELGTKEKTRFSIPPFFAGLLNRWQPVYIIPVLMIAAISGFAFNLAQASLPGDLLYSVKRASEEAQFVIYSGDQKPQMRLELANKRLEDLNKIAEANRVKDLAPTIKEFQASVSEAAKGLVRAEATTSSPMVLRGIAQQVQQLEKNKKKIESLGVVVGETEELNDVLASIVEREIKDLESRTIDEEQQELLKEAQDYYQVGEYSQALEKILILSYPQL